MAWYWYVLIFVGVLIGWVAYDLRQRSHAILHNFPIIGHFRYWLETIGPELRQYIVTNNDEERPFSRDERRWVYASSKRQNNYFGFGTDSDLENTPNYLIIRHAPFPLHEPSEGELGYDPKNSIPCGKTLGAHRQRPQQFRPQSIVNISAMSFGSLSAPAIEALNRGATIASCLHNTGEGGVSPHHQHGGELIWQIGTGYFGCRDQNGRFDLKRFCDVVDSNPIKAIEIKLSQGAKPARGGLLPAKKITKEIAAIRGIPMGKDCASPASHQEFHDVDSMLDFVEKLADETGLPIGIKAAVGQMEFWHDLAEQMQNSQRGVDFITIDGGEGGTGAAPLVFSDHVALPFKLGFVGVYKIFLEAELNDKIVFAGAGRLGLPESALLALSLGADLINVGREAMMAIGCIQAQKCHNGHCPTGVATQNKWLIKGLDPTHKAARLANYVVAFRKELMQLSRACGVPHPTLVSTEQLAMIDDCSSIESVTETFDYPDPLRVRNSEYRAAIQELMGSV